MSAKTNLAAVLMILAGFAALTVGCSNEPAKASLPAPATRPQGAVMANPSVGVSNAAIIIVGAGFKPGETLKVSYSVLAGGQLMEATVGENAHEVKADALGSFQIDGLLPVGKGVYPLRVFDTQGNQVAASLVIVQEKK